MPSFKMCAVLGRLEIALEIFKTISGFESTDCQMTNVFIPWY